MIPEDQKNVTTQWCIKTLCNQNNEIYYSVILK